MKTEVMTLNKENDAQDTQIDAGKSELAAIEAEVEKLNLEHDVVDAAVKEVKDRMAAIEIKVVVLQNSIKETPKVAFSAGLSDTGFIEAGANTGNLNLVFTRVITNVGEAYSKITGIFTAPVRGVYYFRFTVMDILKSHWMVASLLKNGEWVMYLAEYDTDDKQSFLSSGLVLLLEAGDKINMQIPAKARLFDSTGNHNTFSGFLLFTVEGSKDQSPVKSIQ